MPQQEELVWHVLTHEHKEHSTDWYWAAALVIIAGMGLSVYFGNFLLALILLLGIGSILVLKVRGPREHQVRLDARGVTLDGTVYPWSAIQSFSVGVNEYNGDPYIYLATRSLLAPRIAVPLDSIEHGEDVRAFSKRFAQEEERVAHFSEHIAQMLGL